MSKCVVCGEGLINDVCWYCEELKKQTENKTVIEEELVLVTKHFFKYEIDLIRKYLYLAIASNETTFYDIEVIEALIFNHFIYEK